MQCKNDIEQWMSENILEINKYKTEILTLGAHAHRIKITAHLKSQFLTS